jgi:hypothetical protein
LLAKRAKTVIVPTSPLIFIRRSKPIIHGKTSKEFDFWRSPSLPNHFVEASASSPEELPVVGDCKLPECIGHFMGYLVLVQRNAFCLIFCNVVIFLGIEMSETHMFLVNKLRAFEMTLVAEEKT